MSDSFIPSLLVPIVGLLCPFLSIVFFLLYVDKDLIE